MGGNPPPPINIRYKPPVHGVFSVEAKLVLGGTRWSRLPIFVPYASPTLPILRFLRGEICGIITQRPARINLVCRLRRARASPIPIGLQGFPSAVSKTTRSSEHLIDLDSRSYFLLVTVRLSGFPPRLRAPATRKSQVRPHRSATSSGSIVDCCHMSPAH